MPLMESGRVCIKKYGRDAASKAVILSVIDDNFVSIVTSERGRPRRCNIRHLEFINEKVDAKDKAAVAKTLEVETEKVKI